MQYQVKSTNSDKKMRTPTGLKPSHPLTVNIPTKHTFMHNYHEALEDPVEIIPRLYLGSASASRNKEFLERHGVRLIVNCASELANHFQDKFAYCNVRLNDQEELEDALDAFQRGHIGDAIDKTRGRGESVLVHCRAGASRSVTIVITYLMLYKKMTLKDAFLLVKTRRPIAGPNKGYMKQLSELERKTTGVSTFSIREYYQQVLLEMGFDKEKVIAALDYGDCSFNVAVAYLLRT